MWGIAFRATSQSGACKEPVIAEQAGSLFEEAADGVDALFFQVEGDDLAWRPSIQGETPQ